MIPSHQHTMATGAATNNSLSGGGAGKQANSNTGLAGGGLGHTHANGTLAISTITMNVQYIDIIMCSKN